MDEFNNFNVYECEKELCKLLRIEDVASKLGLEAISRRNKKVKWNLVYKTFYKQENTASLKISESKQIFCCFATHKSGNLVKLYKDCKGLKNTEAACRELIKEFELEIKLQNKDNINLYSEDEKNLINFYNLLVNYANYNLINDKEYNKKARNYLEERKIDKELIQIFNLGYIESQEKLDRFIEKKAKKFDKGKLIELGIYNENGKFKLLKKIIIPSYDCDGNIVALTGRSLVQEKENKYIHLTLNEEFREYYPNFEPKRQLYNLNRAKDFIFVKNELIIVEGFFDVIRLNKIGVNNVVAILSTNMSIEQKELLEKYKPLKLIVLLDGDDSGQIEQRKLLNELSSMINEENKEYIFRHTYLINSKEYVLNKEDPNSFFENKNIENWYSFKTNIRDFRELMIQEHIDKYKNDMSFLIDDFDKSVIDYINYYDSTYVKELEILVKKYNKGDMEYFNRLFKINDYIQSLYLMNKLNAEQFYCIDLLTKSIHFVNDFKIYKKFMNEVYDVLINLQNTKLNFYQSINNRKLYGDKSSKLVIDVFDDDETKLYTFELDYISKTFYMFRRFANSYAFEKRNENNFFDAKVVFDIDLQKNRDNALKEIKKEIGIQDDLDDSN